MPPIQHNRAVEATPRPEIKPAAIGRLRFSGCRRSFSRSTQSLSRYTPLAIRQNEITAKDARSTAFKLSNSLAKMSGANAAKFLVHCLGRKETNRSLSVEPPECRARTASEDRT